MPGRASLFSSESHYSGEVADEDAFELPVVVNASPPPQPEDDTDVRTFKLKAVMRRVFEQSGDDSLSFDHFTANVRSRKALAGTFYHTLLLATTGQLDVHQEQPYGDISITKTDLF